MPSVPRSRALPSGLRAPWGCGPPGCARNRMSVHFKLSELRDTSWTDFAVRFAFGGAITVLAGYIAKAYGPALGGLFLAFPAIFPATETLIERTEHERELQNGGLVKMRGRLSAA